MSVDRFTELVIMAASTVAAFCAAWAAKEAAQIGRQTMRDSQQDARRRATFEHLREIEMRALRGWQSGVRSDLLLAETRENRPLSPAAADLMGLLNVLNLFAYAYEHRMIERDLADGYAKNLVRSTDWLLPLITEFQGCCSDPDAYAELQSYIQNLVKKHPAITTHDTEP